jgi:EAL domain-containing protein (putative c-di-GMP-specific phosphodiesterase class I)
MTFTGATFTQPQVLRPGAVLESIIRRRAVQTLFQPILHLPTETVVGFAALSRGPAGSKLENPEALLEAARDAGRLGELDWIFRVAAMEAASNSQLHPSLSWCINVEPAGLAMECPASLRDDYGRSRKRLRAILELTDRDQQGYARTLLSACEDARRDTWGVALDRVGTDERALALLPLLQPDVVKLDRSIIQAEPDANVARITAMVRAYAEKYEAVIIAEGIETPEHATRAEVYGAAYGQGYLFGAPGELPDIVPPPRHPIPLRQEPPPLRHGTPFDVVSVSHEPQVAEKRMLTHIVDHLENVAAHTGGCVMLVGLQHSNSLPPERQEHYRQLSQHNALTVVFADGAPLVESPRYQVMSPGAASPFNHEWQVVVLSADFAGAFLARDMGDRCAEPDRRYEFIYTHDRDTVVSAAKAFLGELPTAA